MIKLYGRIQPKRLFGEIKINQGAFNGKLQAKTVAPGQEDFTVFPDSGFKGLSHVIVEAATLQEKTIKPSGIEQTVVPDVGVYGLSKVIVEAQGNHGLLEEKTVSPSEEEQILTPGEGYYGIQSVTVKAAPLEEKTATSTDQDQIVKPSEGYYGMDQVIVKGIPNAEDYTFSEVATFPVIPADYLAANPYAIIVETSISGATAYVLTVSASAFFYASGGGERGLGTLGSGTVYYVTVGGVAWSKVQDFTAGNGMAVLSASDSLVWANHDVTDANEGFTYFAKSDVYPAASAEVYRIQKETADGIGREINRLWKTAEPMTAERMKEKLEDLDIELTELTVYPTDEVQTIAPDGYYGFSKIIVEAAEGSGGGSGEGEDEPTGGAAENTTFGNETVEDEVETGLLDYSGGKDEDAPGLPAIPTGNFQALFKVDLKLSTEAVVYTEGKSTARKVRTHVPTYIYAVRGYYKVSGTGSTYQGYTRLYVVSPDYFAYEIKNVGQNWSSYNAAYKSGDYYRTFDNLYSIQGAISSMNGLAASWGVPFYDMGLVESFEDAALAFVESAEPTGKYLAFVSNTQIRYNGSTVNNEDGSSMFIYECDSLDTNEWVQIGTTGGGDYPVGSYTLEWNSHDMLDLSGETVTQEASGAPVPETETATVTRPVERDEIYTIAGDSLNSLIATAQKITGTNTPMTPEEAVEALEKYYAGLSA